MGTDIETAEPTKLLGLVVNDLARLMRKRFEQVARMRRLGFTRAQAAVLIHLARNEGINQVTLAQLMELEPITLVRLLDRLQLRGLIERRADPFDRRARNLFLTAAARPLLARIEVLANEVREEALSGLDAAEREALFAMLARMKGNLTLQLTAHCAAEPAEEVALHG